MGDGPVRLAVSDRDVVRGLRRMLADHTHRVVVLDAEADASAAADLVLGETGADEAPPATASSWVPPRLAVERIVALIEAAAGQPSRREPAVPTAAGLSGREEQVLLLVAEGLTNQEIADRMYVSINSVKTYLRVAYRKAGVGTRTQAVMWCLQHGLVEPEQTP